MPAIHHRAKVNRENIALAQRIRARNAVDNRLVNRGADDTGERLDALDGRIALEVGGRPMPLQLTDGERIERGGGDPRPHCLAQFFQNRHDDLARAADARNLCSAVILNRHAAMLRQP